VQFSELQRPGDLDFESGLYICTYQISLKLDKLFVDGHMDRRTY